MVRKSEEDAEWTQQRAEVGIELAQLIDEYGMEAVLAECSAFVAENVNKREKNHWQSEQSADSEFLTPDENSPLNEEDVLDCLEEHDGLRIEMLADELDAEFSEAKETIHNLRDQCLVVSGPDATFEADRAVPPHLQ